MAKCGKHIPSDKKLFKSTYGKYFKRFIENTLKTAENNYPGWSNDY